jgi:hypothetical protein
MQAGSHGSKAAPETSTTPANATGILDLSLQSLSIKDQHEQTNAHFGDSKRSRASHSYRNPPPIIAYS